MAHVRRERWTPARAFAVGLALVSFYVSYMAYRNLKAVVPLLRPGDLFDVQLGAIERDVLGGHDPAALLHSLLGRRGLRPTSCRPSTSPSSSSCRCRSPSRSCSPRSCRARAVLRHRAVAQLAPRRRKLPAAAVAGPDLRRPGRVRPPAALRGHAPAGDADGRSRRLPQGPGVGTPQAIAAFASLHVSMSFTAALSAHLLGVGRKLKIALWIWVGLTCSPRSTSAGTTSRRHRRRRDHPDRAGARPSAHGRQAARAVRLDSLACPSATSSSTRS